MTPNSEEIEEHLHEDDTELNPTSNGNLFCTLTLQDTFLPAAIEPTLHLAK